MEAAQGTTSWLDAVAKVGPIDPETIAADTAAFNTVKGLVQQFIRSKRAPKSIVAELITGGDGDVAECETCGLARTCEVCKPAEANRLHQSQMKAWRDKKWRGYYVRGKFPIRGLTAKQIASVVEATDTYTSKTARDQQVLVFADGSIEVVPRARHIPDTVRGFGEHKRSPSSGTKTRLQVDPLKIQSIHDEYPVVALLRPVTAPQMREIVSTLSVKPE